MPRFDSSSLPLDPAARITTERVEMALRTRFDPLPTLSPQRLVEYLQQFERGYLGLAARTWEAMERRDDRLASVSAKAKSALARYGFEVRVRPNLPLALREEAAKHQAALEYLYSHCTVTNAVREDEQGGFSLLVRQMADAIGKKYSVHEIVWEPSASGTLTATFRHAPLWFFEATSGKLRYKPQEGAATGIDMDPEAWLVTVGDGIMEACSVLWVYKHLPLHDWLAYSEKFGLPYLLGKTQAIFNSQEWLAMVSALRGFGNDGAAVVGGADDIVPVKVGSGSEATPFPGLVERSERAMSILWRGADLGTQAHSGSGQGQGASLQGDETAALDEDRAAGLTESLASVSRTAIKYLFGESVQPLAYVRLKTQVAQDIQLDLAVDAFLLSNGAPLGLADVLARYGRPTPGADEPLLKPPGSAGGGGSGGGAKAAASEDATLASIERAANGAASRLTFPNDDPYHDAQGRFTNAAGAVPPRNKDRSPKSNPKGVKRTDHHVATVSTLRKVNFSEDVVRALEKLKVPAGTTRGMPEHQNNTAHIAYNERENEIASQYTDLARSKDQDPSTMTGKQAEAFAKGLVEQINADPYCNTFNEMVGNGATTEKLNTMHASSGALLQAEPTLTEGAELSLETPVETSPVSTEASEPVTAKPAEVPESTGAAPEGIASGSGEMSSATDAALGVLNLVGVLHDFLEAAAEEEDGDEGKMADALAMRDFPPDKHPGFLGRLHTILTRDPSPYYSPEQLKKFDEQRQDYRIQFKERRRRHHGVPSA